jgi:hypothetical protein
MMIKILRVRCSCWSLSSRNGGEAEGQGLLIITTFSVSGLNCILMVQNRLIWRTNIREYRDKQSIVEKNYGKNEANLLSHFLERIRNCIQMEKKHVVLYWKYIAIHREQKTNAHDAYSSCGSKSVMKQYCDY